MALRTSRPAGRWRAGSRRRYFARVSVRVGAEERRFRAEGMTDSRVARKKRGAFQFLDSNTMACSTLCWYLAYEILRWLCDSSRLRRLGAAADQTPRPGLHRHSDSAGPQMARARSGAAASAGGDAWRDTVRATVGRHRALRRQGSLEVGAGR